MHLIFYFKTLLNCYINDSWISNWSCFIPREIIFLKGPFLYVNLTFLVFFSPCNLFICLSVFRKSYIVRERERPRVLPSADSLPRWPRGSGQARSKLGARNQDLNLDHLAGGRGLSIRAIFGYFPRVLAESWRGNPRLNWHPYKKPVL